jgi:hypothetical protein
MLAKSVFEKQDKEKKRQKVIILVTDWDANVWIDPTLAAKVAKESWIKIYTIWIWGKKWVYIRWLWVIPPLKAKTLKEIVNITNWKFYRADSNYNFVQIFNELKKLQSSDIEIKIQKTYAQYYYNLAIILLIIFSIYMFFVFRKI